MKKIKHLMIQLAQTFGMIVGLAMEIKKEPVLLMTILSVGSGMVSHMVNGRGIETMLICFSVSLAFIVSVIVYAFLDLYKTHKEEEAFADYRANRFGSHD